MDGCGVVDEGHVPESTANGQPGLLGARAIAIAGQALLAYLRRSNRLQADNNILKENVHI